MLTNATARGNGARASSIAGLAATRLMNEAPLLSVASSVFMLLLRLSNSSRT
ncbi:MULTISPECIES: hypothetical protein [Pseudomonas syringae group]|uniref:hypothetical protein n=1 Tax=Pseudomonas syringae group TaxID=136849 RepID=UPI000208D960